MYLIAKIIQLLFFFHFAVAHYTTIKLINYVSKDDFNNGSRGNIHIQSLSIYSTFVWLNCSY
jgi:hypothetical protein